MTIQYRLARFIIRIWLYICGHKVIGIENIPSDKSMIIAGNHNSFADPVLLGVAFPFQVSFLVRSEFAKNTLVRWFLNSLGAVFLKRGEADVSALKSAINLLKKNKSIGIFPEGTRHHEDVLGELKSGVAFIAFKADVPIIPVAIFNPHHILCFWKRDMLTVIGKPIYIPNIDKPKQEVIGQYMNALREELLTLLHKYHK